MKTETGQTVRIYWEHTMRYKALFALLVFTVIATSAITAVMPVVARELINALSKNSQTWAGREVQLVWVIFGVGLTIQTLYRVMGYMVNYVQPRVMADLYNTCYDYVTKHSYGFFANSFIGAIVTKIRRYQASYERVTDALLFELFPTALRIMFVQFAIFFTLDLVVGLTMLVWVALYGSFAYWFTQFKLPYDLRLAAQDTKTTAHVADTLTNFVNLKLYASRGREASRFFDTTNELFRLRKQSWDLSNHANVFQGTSMLVLEFAVLYISVPRVINEQMTVGEFVMLQGYMGIIIERMWNVTRQLKNLYEGLADANEMTGILLEPHEIADHPEAVALQVSRGGVRFSDVSFYYHHESGIFNGLNLSINPGEKVGLVGYSGGGKSTIVKLLLRMNDIQAGVIRIDGQDISMVTQDSLRKAIAYVPQDPSMFHRSLMDNIRYCREDATDKEVIEAAKAAHAHEFIAGFADGYNTLVGERGVKLSGGERQRVAIARAILQNATILVLDEATSSLDSESEMHIQVALENLMRGKTVIAIAHRLSTISNMDRILVMENGHIKEEGTHDELIDSNGTYQRLWNIQVGGFARDIG